MPVGKYTWAGREFDAESGLYYNRARYYDPKVGRFTSEDPIGFNAGDSNLYRYVMNEPTGWTDPSGLYIKFKEMKTGLIDPGTGRDYGFFDPKTVGENWVEILNRVYPKMKAELLYEGTEGGSPVYSLDVEDQAPFMLLEGDNYGMAFADEWSIQAMAATIDSPDKHIWGGLDGDIRMMDGTEITPDHNPYAIVKPIKNWNVGQRELAEFGLGMLDGLGEIFVGYVVEQLTALPLMIYNLAKNPIAAASQVWEGLKKMGRSFVGYDLEENFKKRFEKSFELSENWDTLSWHDAGRLTSWMIKEMAQMLFQVVGGAVAAGTMTVGGLTEAAIGSLPSKRRKGHQPPATPNTPGLPRGPGTAANPPPSLGASINAERGGLNLYKWGQPQTAAPTGWRPGDRMLALPNRGDARQNWQQNSSAIRIEMRRGEPIFDSYRDPVTGLQITTGGFLNAERILLESHGWRYNPATGAYHPPGMK
jgi:RHS repeat-associated protein